HFMLKEICEQPETVRSTLRGRLLFAEGTARLNGLNLTPEACAQIRRITIVACGTSWHAGLVGRALIEELARIPVQVEYASEYRYRRPLPVPDTLTIAISQSGETADTLEAMRAARVAGSRVFGLVNVGGSTIARESDGGDPAAEMKHGPIALIDENMPAVFVAPKDDVYTKVLSNMQEVRARGGRIIAVTTQGNGSLSGLVDHQLRVPETAALLSPIVT